MKSALRAIMTLGRVMPEHPAIVLADRIITFGMLVAGIDSVEKKIASLRFDRERPVGIDIQSKARHLIVDLALLKSGLCSVSLTGDLERRSELVQPGIILSDLARKASVPVAIVNEDWFTSGNRNAPFRSADLVSNRFAKIFFTSGSTGTPKPVALTSDALSRRMFGLQQLLLSRTGRVLCSYGVSIAVGYVASVTLLAHGRTVCFERSTEEAVDMLRAMSITGIAASVQQLRQIVDFCRSEGRFNQFSSVKMVFTGGAYLPLSLAHDLQTLFPAEILEFYASAEAGIAGISTMSLKAQRSTSGVFFPCTDVRVLQQQGNALAIKSDAMAVPFTGSLDGPLPSDDADYFLPGDTGSIDESGLLTINGRVDDVINFGGVKMQATQIETALQQCPLIFDCAVVDIDGLGSRKNALVFVLAKGASLNDLTTWLKREVSGFHFDMFVETASLPRKEMGKLSRPELRQIVQRQISSI